MKTQHRNMALVLSLCTLASQTALAQSGAFASAPPSLRASWRSDCEGVKAVAHVKDTVISEEEYLDRVQRVRQIPPNSGLDAGGFTLLNMIQDCLTDQLAVEKKATPSEAAVKQLAGIIRRMTPDVEQRLLTQQLTETELEHQVRHLLEVTALGTDGAKADPVKVQATYDEMKKTPIFPATYTIRMMFVPDATQAQKVIEKLKTTRDFRAEALALKLSPTETANAGRELIMSKKAVPEELLKALDALGNGPFTPENGPFTSAPVTVNQKTPMNQPAPRNTLYIVAQLIGKQAEETPPLEQIRLYVEQRTLQQSQAQWEMHSKQLIGEYTRKALEQKQIQIHIERYQTAIESVLLAQANPPPAPTPGPPPPNRGGSILRLPPGETGKPAGSPAPNPSGNKSKPPPSL
ncbi:MAG TPA: peptidylprolyl isomerase [Chthonomonadaceae bacterium]|nr:peptidylprolyl isomerase [Chthonomonadaceae bacterium]